MYKISHVANPHTILLRWSPPRPSCTLWLRRIATTSQYGTIQRCRILSRSVLVVLTPCITRVARYYSTAQPSVDDQDEIEQQSATYPPRPTSSLSPQSLFSTGAGSENAASAGTNNDVDLDSHPVTSTDNGFAPDLPEQLHVSEGDDAEGIWSPRGKNHDIRGDEDKHSHFEDLWTGSARKGKVDLSVFDASSGQPFNQVAKDTIPKSTAARVSTFRGDSNHSNSRPLTKYFMRHLYRRVSSTQDVPDEALRGFLAFSRQPDVPPGPYDIDRLLTWSWLLLADPKLMVRRLSVLDSRHGDDDGLLVPEWILLQMLRAPVIDSASLHTLIEVLNQRLATWDWKGSSPMILTVRLLRHARATAPVHYEAIISLFIRLLGFMEQQGYPTDPSKLTIWCDSIISLLSMSSNVHPFKSMTYQQAGLFKLLQFMQHHDPELPILRNGFRAIASLQLMHPKTEEETTWARAKALTWPPWEEKHRMGYDPGELDYPGQRTRVMKVIERMQEAGYAPDGYDRALRVLTGWDTDDSPTIQVRRSSSHLPKPPFMRQNRERENMALIWSARIEATRTLREAWMVFCSFDTSTPTKVQEDAPVYNAMFRKLWTPTLDVDAHESGPVPGDGLELYHDPPLARDQVHIPEPIPDVPTLHARMVAGGIRAPVRMLSHLLQHAPDYRSGLNYIDSALINDTARLVLTQPHNTHFFRLVNVLDELPLHFVRAYIGLMARPLVKTKAPFHACDGSLNGIATPEFARGLLEYLPKADHLCWREFFSQLQHHVDGSMHDRHKMFIGHVWNLTLDALAIRRPRHQSDFETFRHIGNVAFAVLTYEKDGVCETHGTHDPVTVAKSEFVAAAFGRPAGSQLGGWQDFIALEASAKHPHKPEFLHNVPSGDAIETMFWILGAAQTQSTVTDILSLLRWICEHRPTILEDGRSVSRHNYAVARAFLVGDWVPRQGISPHKTVVVATPEELDTARSWIHKAGGTWPRDDYMKQFFWEERARFNRVKRRWSLV